MDKINNSAYRKFTNHIEALIASGVYLPGAKLPSLEQLIQETKLSSYAVQKGMKYLQQKGLIELRHGSGTYVSTSRKNGNSRHGWNITIFCGTNGRELGSSYLAHSLLGIQELATEHGCNLTLRPRDYYQYLAPEPPIASLLHDADGIIFLGEYDCFKLEIPPTIPAVGIDMVDSGGGMISPIALDPVEGARLAVDFFRRRGKKKVRAFAIVDIPYIKLEIEAFQKYFAPHGEVEFCFSKIGDRSVSLDESPENGLLFFSGHRCEYYLKAYWAKHGEEMTRQFDILSIDGKSLMIPNYHPVSTVWIDWKEAGETAFVELLRRLEHPGKTAHRITLIPKITELQ